MKVFEQSNEKIDFLEKIYAENPYHARVMYQNLSAAYKKYCIEIVDNGKYFEMLKFRKSVGIGENNRIFRKNTLCEKIIYDGKFWIKTGSTTKRLDADAFLDFININNITDEITEQINDFIYSKVPWMKYIFENETLQYRALNTFVKHKLFSLRVALKHFYGVPLNVCDALISYGKVTEKIFNFLIAYKTNRKYFHNIENLGDIMHYNRMDELIEAAKMLGKKINCKWTSKRAATQLQRWDHEASMIIVGYEIDEDLKPAEIFLEFEKHTGFRLLKTRREIIYEGLMQHNCISTYVGYVKSGRSGIYHYDGYTIEMINPAYMKDIDEENEAMAEVPDDMEDFPMTPIGDLAEANEKRIFFSQIRKTFNDTANNMMHNFMQTLTNKFNGDDLDYGIIGEDQIRDDEGPRPEPGIPYHQGRG